MRTTIELSDDLVSILHAIAVKKGYRGYSKVVEEALHFYLRENRESKIDLDRILKMRGSWPQEEANRVKTRLEEIRKNWKV